MIQKSTVLSTSMYTGNGGSPDSSAVRSTAVKDFSILARVKTEFYEFSCMRVYFFIRVFCAEFSLHNSTGAPYRSAEIGRVRGWVTYPYVGRRPCANSGPQLTPAGKVDLGS